MNLELKENSKRDYCVVLFDGVCNLCNATIDFLIRKDKKRKLRYASLQSEFGQRVLQDLGLPGDRFESFILLDPDGKITTKSRAALKIAGLLGMPWSFLRILLVVPRPIGDYLYSLVAANRYRLFGRRESCRIATPEERSLFLE